MGEHMLGEGKRDDVSLADCDIVLSLPIECPRDNMVALTIF